jgi:cell division protein FtsA
MYSTCIGLILKGYNDYENKNKQMGSNFTKVELNDTPEVEAKEEVSAGIEEGTAPIKIKQRKLLQGFMDRFKTNLIDLFKEEEDTKF